MKVTTGHCAVLKVQPSVWRRRKGGTVSVSGFGPDEQGRAAFGGVVRAQMMAVYGVQLPLRLERVVDEAAVLRLAPEDCVAAIGEAFSLRPLPVRRQGSKSSES